ncbi:hypothetical protein ZIOFF_054376 [Zingiber officinale]|uniref:CCHC-type domain-containing protein n=1 Tax=Zingiber officinale TaxID=94328 RepID=A0A8J5KMG3_ZINOF|nr:hypothetical protein ZIOFF_054376 [Zingiber officinale]
MESTQESAINVAYILNLDLPAIPPPTKDDSEELRKQRAKLEEDEVLCRGHIFNTLSDTLYDLFKVVKNPREIWTTLDHDMPLKNKNQISFLLIKHFEFKLDDNSPLIDQIYNLQVIVSKLKDYGVEISESIIEEGARILYKKEKESDPRVNLVEENRFNKRKKLENVFSSDMKKTSRFCYNCGKKSHYKAECRAKKKQKISNAPSANAIESAEIIVAMVTLDQFKIYEVLEGHDVIMANGARAKVLGKGSDLHQLELCALWQWSDLAGASTSWGTKFYLTSTRRSLCPSGGGVIWLEHVRMMVELRLVALAELRGDELG